VPIDDAAGRRAIRSWIEQQHADLDRRSYFQLLDVARDAGDAEIADGYRRMAGRFHPDLYGDSLLEEDVRAKLVTLYSRLVEAYHVLRDPAKRAAYVKTLEAGRLRFSQEAQRAQAARRDEDDISNPHARRFFLHARAALAHGDAKAAVMNYRLALSVEPDSALIVAELARAEALYRGKG
jgi:DnaJ-class molecular chaperone